jgi:hypothetical protein
VKDSRKQAVERFRGWPWQRTTGARRPRRRRAADFRRGTGGAFGSWSCSTRSGRPREVRRVARRHLARGLEAALSEDPRPKPEEKFDTRREAAIVALVCSPPPPGRTRWTVRLLAREAERQGIVASVGKETIRRLLESHELKPWREKMRCVPELTREYVERMEDVLDLMEKPANDREPVVALDERPVQLLATGREGTPMAPERIARSDYEYIRCGTANVFCIVAPKTGRHLTYATANRKARRFAAAVKRISDAYPNARRIHLILDNLNTHRLKSLTDAYGEVRGRRLWRRFVLHHTPKHGSWLNPADIEVSLWLRECVGRDRVATLCELKYRTRLWNKAANRDRRKINWRFTSADARRLFRYHPGTTPGPDGAGRPRDSL